MCNAKNFGLIWQASQILINEQLDAQMYSAPNYTAPELAELLKALLDQDVEFCENFLRSIGDMSSYGCLLALKKLSMKRQIKLLPMFNIVSFSHYSMSACAGVLQNWSPKNRQQFLQTIDSDGLHALFRRIITDESKKMLLNGASNAGREDVLNRLGTITRTAYLIWEAKFEQKQHELGEFVYLNREISPEVRQAAVFSLYERKELFSHEVQMFFLSLVPEVRGIE